MKEERKKGGREIVKEEVRTEERKGRKEKKERGRKGGKKRGRKEREIEATFLKKALMSSEELVSRLQKWSSENCNGRSVDYFNAKRKKKARNMRKHVIIIRT